MIDGSHLPRENREPAAASIERLGVKSFFQRSTPHPSPITAVAAEAVSGLLPPEVSMLRRRYTTVTIVASGKLARRHEFRTTGSQEYFVHPPVNLPECEPKREALRRVLPDSVISPLVARILTSRAGWLAKWRCMKYRHLAQYPCRMGVTSKPGGSTSDGTVTGAVTPPHKQYVWEPR